MSVCSPVLRDVQVPRVLECKEPASGLSGGVLYASAAAATAQERARMAQANRTKSGIRLCMYASCLYRDANATLDDLREAVETLEDVERIARRVLGGAHPFVDIIEHHVRNALRAREASSPGSA